MCICVCKNAGKGKSMPVIWFMQKFTEMHVYTHGYVCAERPPYIRSFFTCGGFRKLGVPYFGVLIMRILLFRVLYWFPLFSETPM